MKQTTIYAIYGAVAVIVLFIIGAAITVYFGLYNVSADDQHTVPVRTFINYARDRAVAVHLSEVDVPPLKDPQMIAKGAGEYDSLCTACHLAPGMNENDLRAGLNPKPPSFAKRRRPGIAAEQFWDIKHGFKMTGMPAWGATHSDPDIWNIVAFMQTMPGMTGDAYKQLVASAPPVTH